jgi:predicted hotdog family 3-hydroxylacyl-ACP dehydratase
MNDRDRMSLPPIEKIVPHRGSMLLIDEVIDDDADSIRCRTRVRGDAWYADGAGDMPALLGIELMAQTVAAFIGLSRWRAGETAQAGFLLGSRKYVSEVGVLRRDAVIDIRARTVYREPSGLGAFDCQILESNQVRVTAVLTVFEPKDMAAFLKEQNL